MKLLLSFILFSFIIINTVYSQTDKSGKFKNDSKSTYDIPYLNFRVHKNGRFWNTILNTGIVGNYMINQDPDLQLEAPNYYFPRYSRIRHGFYTALWVGGVVGNDTLVSTALDVDVNPTGQYFTFNSEFWPDLYHYPYFFEDYVNEYPGEFSDLSNTERRYVSVFNDTLKNFFWNDYNPYDMRPHRPLNIEVVQRSYSWSYGYAEDFIILDFEIINIGKSDIKNGFLGLHHLACNHYQFELPNPPPLDAMVGYIDSIPYENEELGYKQLNLSWNLDISGNPIGNVWWPLSTRHAFGIAPLDLPKTAYIRNFNWWVNRSDRSWGPRKRDKLTGSVRLFHGDFGQPLDDKSKYYMMSHPERDYSTYYASVNMERFGWIAPFEFADEISDGSLVHYLTSFGPFDLIPGDGVHYTFVLSMGENVHSIPFAYREYFDPEDPKPFLETLDFSDLISNIDWAGRIYDNPGVDSDKDGDSGKYYFLVDTVTYDSTQIFYTGDGIPDFKGAAPPPPPIIRLYTEKGKIIIRWNGRDTENFYDSFSRARDFEGYRIYLARSQDENDIVLLCSFDKENYNRYRWNHRYLKYELFEIPFTLDSLRSLYGPDFEPLEYTRTNPLEDNGRIYYFTKVGYNTSDLNNQDNIHKMYPDAINDTTDVDEDGRMRYFEYEYIIDNLLPTVPYYISVTAFDFGLPSKNMLSLESSPYHNQKKAVALDQEDISISNNELNVYCYPNPYRTDVDYRGKGYEMRFEDKYAERGRSLYFANLPDKCTIKIFSLDGDLIIEMEHDEPEGSGTRAFEEYDLISKNDMAITTGLYYWVVESEYGKQIGKLVILK